MDQPVHRALADSTTGPYQPSNLFERLRRRIENLPVQPCHPPDSTTGSIEELVQRRQALRRLQLVARRVRENNTVGTEKHIY